MDVDAILNALAGQGAPAVALKAVGSLVADEADVDAQRYQPDRAAELKRGLRATTVDAIVAEWRRLDDEAITRGAEEQDATAQAEHARVAGVNGHGVDHARITAAQTPAEITLLLRDAESSDIDTLRRTWAFAEPRLRAMAQDEMRRHRQPGAASAFHALTGWQMRMRDVTRRTPDRAALSERAARRRQEIKQQVLAVARVVGLAEAVERAARMAAVPVPQKSSITSGAFFDRFTR